MKQDCSGVATELPRDDNGQAAAREFVEHHEHSKGPAILSAILDEVIGPDVIGTLRSQANARAIVGPKPAPFRLLYRHFEPFPAPDAVDPLDVHSPALGNEHLADAAVAVATIARRQPHDRVRQRRFVVGHLLPPPLRRTRLPYDSAGSALRDGKTRADVRDAHPLAGRAQY
jgi:hypothetical protein